MTQSFQATVRLPQVDPQAYLQAMKAQVEQTLIRVMGAVNDAPAGQVIDASEEEVRDLFAQLRCSAYQTAVQMRADAAEAAFSPGG